MPRFRAVFMTVTLVLVLGVAGCGDDDTPDSRSGSTGSSSTSGATSTSAAPSPAGGGAAGAVVDANVARTFLVTRADLPAGWTASPPEPDSDRDRQDARELAACVGGADPDAAYTLDEDGPDFEHEAGSVGSNVSVVRVQGDYDKDVAALQSPRLETCLREQLARALAREGATVKDVRVGRLPVEQHGTMSVGLTLSATLSAGGQSTTVFQDAVFLGTPRVEVTLTFTRLGAPFDRSLESSVVTAVGRRLDAAAA